jgi:trk system potassium uptake protein TrkA
MRIGDEAEVFEITVAEEAPTAGKTLKEAARSDPLTDEMLVVAIERDDNDHPITARGETTIKVGDLLAGTLESMLTRRLRTSSATMKTARMT